MSSSAPDLATARAQVTAVVDRAKADPAYKQQLLDQPKQTLQAAGLAEEVIEDFLRQEGAEGEVAGYAYCQVSCYFTQLCSVTLIIKCSATAV